MSRTHSPRLRPVSSPRRPQRHVDILAGIPYARGTLPIDRWPDVRDSTASMTRSADCNAPPAGPAAQGLQRLASPHVSSGGRRARRIIAATLRAAAVGMVALASSAWAVEMPAREDFFDADDGYLDISRFLDRAYGFVPLVIPITEPAVGYGAVGALVFIDRRGEPGSETFRRPNLAVKARHLRI